MSSPPVKSGLSTVKAGEASTTSEAVRLALVPAAVIVHVPGVRWP